LTVVIPPALAASRRRSRRRVFDIVELSFPAGKKSLAAIGAPLSSAIIGVRRIGRGTVVCGDLWRDAFAASASA
jgi:hypothetical protein